MAFTVIRLVDKNKITEKAPVGFSWTTLFFGFFVPLTRNDWIYALIMLGASIITLGISILIFPFIYNKIFIQSLVKKGFKAKSYEPVYKEHQQLNVKKEKAMIREEAGIGAEGIIAKTFVEKERSNEKEYQHFKKLHLEDGHIDKIIGQQEENKNEKIDLGKIVVWIAMFPCVITVNYIIIWHLPLINEIKLFDINFGLVDFEKYGFFYTVLFVIISVVLTNFICKKLLKKRE